MKKIVAPTEAAPRAERSERAAARPWPLWLALAGLAGLAFLLRAATIGQSLPFVDHPDEPNPIDYVVGMLRSGDPNQQFFQKPSLFVYLCLAAIQAHYRAGLAAGAYAEIGQMIVTTHTVTTVPGFFMVARLISAGFGALTALAAYGLGARGWGRAAGLVGALYLALLPYHQRFSQWATTDVTATFLATMSLSAALLAGQTNRWGAYLVAGSFAGLAASAKYNAGAVAGAVAVAAAVAALARLREPGARPGRVLLEQSGRLALAGGAAVACFVAGTPYALLSPDLVGGGIARQWTNYGGANGHYRGAWNLAGYGGFFWNESLGPIGILLALAGLGLLARRRPAVLAVWLGFALPSLLIHLSRPTHFMQNMLPLLAACALPIGVAVVELPRLLGRGRGERGPGGQGDRGRLVLLGQAGLLALLLVPMGLGAGQQLSRQLAGDSRLQMLAWLEANVPPGARIAGELKPIPGPGDAPWTEMPALPAHDLAFYRAQGYAYLIGSSNRWGQFTLPASYGALGAPLAEFGPIRREDMLGPRLAVWATGLGPGDVPRPLAQEVRVGGARLVGVALGDPSGEGEPPTLVPGAPLRPGGVLGLRTFWQVEAPFERDLLIFVHLIDASGARPTQRDAEPWQGRYPTSSWRAGSMVVDMNDVYLPPGMAPGEYRVLVGMYDPASGERPPVTADGRPVPEGMVEVARVTIGP